MSDRFNPQRNPENIFAETPSSLNPRVLTNEGEHDRAIVASCAAFIVASSTVNVLALAPEFVSAVQESNSGDVVGYGLSLTFLSTLAVISARGVKGGLARLNERRKQTEFNERFVNIAKANHLDKEY